MADVPEPVAPATAGAAVPAIPAADPHRPHDATAPVIVALFVTALALRPQISAIGPLVPGIIAEFGASHAFVGLLTAIPVLCMGLFALAGPSVAARLGTRGGVAASVAVLVAFGVLRAIAPGAELVLLATFGVGVGTALVGPILPMFVRDRIPGHMVGGTSSYAGGTIVGAAIGSALAVPLALALGGWRESLLALSLASGLCVVAWLLIIHHRRAGGEGSAPARRVELPKLPVRRPVAWAIGLLFGLQSWLYYGQTAWLPSIYIERGWEPQAAAILLSAVSLASLVAIVLVPSGARRGLSRRVMLTTASGMSLVGLAGIALVPGALTAWLWAAILGGGLGMTFTLLLTLPTDISDDPREVGGAAALMLLVGFLLASGAPSVLGAVRDATGEFEGAVWVLVAVAATMLPLSWSLTPHRLRRRREAVPLPA